MTYKIDRLFGSATRTSLLSKLVIDSGRSFYIRELSRLLDIPYSMLYKEMKNLESLGIVKEEKRGRITIISLNKELPYLEDLKRLIIKTSGLAYVLEGVLSEVKGIKYALVYGSFAGGTETGSSDVDLLIVGKADATDLLRKIRKTEARLSRDVDYIIWSYDELLGQAKAGKGLLLDISRKPIIMIIGVEDEFREIVKGRHNPQDKARP